VGQVTAPAPFGATLHAAQAGSERALSSLYEELQPAVLAFLRARAPRDADDLSSEVWLAVTRGIHGFEGDEPGFRAWVFTIARRRLVDARRRHERRPTAPLGEVEIETSDAGPEATMIAAAATQDLLAGLPKDQADVVRLRVVDGFSVEEAAARLGKRPGTVRVLQHRALRRLATIVASGLAGIVLLVALGLGGVLPQRAEALAREIVDRIGLDVLLPAEATSGGVGGSPASASSSSAPATAPAARGVETRSARVVEPGAEERLPDSSGAPAGDTATADAGNAPPSGSGRPTSDPPPGSVTSDPPPQSGPPESPPGLDDVIPPGQGGTPPGHGGIPPGQAKKL
jgi:RNA polymerase sigma-70 factor, ECF subfamily